MRTTHKSGFAALVGRPNAGKSTMLNALVGEHIAAVSSKPQTTRTRIQGIITRPEGQIIFVDTPGIHKPGYTLNRRMMGIVAEALAQVDVILLMHDATSRPGSGDRFTLDLIRQAAKPTFLLLNKVDLIKDKKKLLPLIEQYSREHDFAEIIPISARTGAQLEELIKTLFRYLPEGPQLFDPELFTDQIERNIAAELVREKILELTGEELPFATAVRTESWEEGADATEIHCVIYVERESQKPIIIGKGGQMLKTIGTRARHDIEKMLDRHVRLFLFVRVQEQWRDDPHLLDELGIEERRGGGERVRRGEKEKGGRGDTGTSNDPPDSSVRNPIQRTALTAIRNPPKVWHAVEVEISRVGESAATTQLWSFGTTGIEVSEDAPETVTLRAYFESAPDEAKLREQIVRALRLSDLPEFALRGMKSVTVADQDWLAEWKRGYEPVAIGERLLIVPSWKLSEIEPGGRIVIQIDPGMAFGTGTHETTRGCLEMLEKYWRSGALLDAGTGTGILAFAAARLAPGSRVIGFDIDPEAIEVARENAEINGVADEVELEVNKLASFHGQGFDVVVANLTADVIIPLVADFAQVVKPRGTLIVSGILREQSDEVKAALAAQKFEVVESRPDGEWITFAARLSPPA